jgi:DNA-directed RNA polymerase subunit omega
VAYIPLEKLLRGSISLYDLVMAASKRATQLAQGSPVLIQTQSKKLTTIALEEFAEGKVQFESYKPEDVSGEAAKEKDSK